MRNAERRILSVSWVGQGDFGDEAMAYALRRAFTERGLPPPIYYQDGGCPRFTAPDEVPLERLHPYSRRDLVRRLYDQVLLRPLDAVVIGGGSLFHSEWSVQWKHEIVRRIRAGAGPRAVVAAIGVSVGPFSSAAAEDAFARFAQDVDLFITRDEDSAKRVAITGTPARIVSAVDLSFLLPGFLGDQFPRAGASHAGPIGLSIVRHADDAAFETEGRFGYFLDVINGLLRAGRDVRLFTLYVGSAYADAAVNERLKRESIAPDRVSHHVFDGDILATARAIADCTSCCAQRLHAMLFAYLTGVPFVSLGYHPKNAHACSTLGYPAAFVFEQQDRPEAGTLVRLLGDMGEGRIEPFAGARRVEAAAADVAAGCDAFVALT